MKLNKNINRKKLSLVKEKIASLSSTQMQSIIAGQNKQGGNSTKHDFTCTWCTNSVPCTVTITVTK